MSVPGVRLKLLREEHVRAHTCDLSAICTFAAGLKPSIVSAAEGGHAMGSVQREARIPHIPGVCLELPGRPCRAMTFPVRGLLHKRSPVRHAAMAICRYCSDNSIRMPACARRRRHSRILLLEDERCCKLGIVATAAQRNAHEAQCGKPGRCGRHFREAPALTG